MSNLYLGTLEWTVRTVTGALSVLLRMMGHREVNWKVRMGLSPRPFRQIAVNDRGHLVVEFVDGLIVNLGEVMMENDHGRLQRIVGVHRGATHAR